MSNARTVILDRIRHALADVDRSKTTPIERAYRTTDDSPHHELVDQFHERVAEYKATVHRVGPAMLAQAIADCCRGRGVKRLVVPADLPSDWLPAGVEVVVDHALSNEQLDQSNGVLTACALGIAQTGTIVLDGGAGQGRRAITLVPDYHLCVIREDQIVGLVPEAVRRLKDSEKRPITWISGPSATSDIELNRVEGVHGPRTLEVLIVATDQN